MMFLTCVVLMTIQRYEKFNRPPNGFSERSISFNETENSLRKARLLSPQSEVFYLRST